MSDLTDPPLSDDAPEPRADAPDTARTASGSAPIPAWSSLDSNARVVAGSGIAAAVVLVAGGVVGAWASSEFLLIAVVGAVIAAGAAWLEPLIESTTARFSIRARTIAVLAAAVVAVLAIMNGIEMLFDLDQLDERGGIVGAALTAVLAIDAATLLGAAVRPDPQAVAAARPSAPGPGLASVGLALVLVAWGLNLASYWTMTQATLALGILTLAAVIVLLAGRGLPLLTAWVGVALGAIGALIALDHWGQLQRLGETRLELGVTDFVPFLLYALGIAAIIAGGVMTAGGIRSSSAAAPTDPEA